MATPMNQSAVPGILKELYDDQKAQWLTYKDNPTLAMIKKSTKFPGKYFPLPVIYGTGGAGSATFGTAYANQSSPLVAEFLVTRVADFVVASIDGQLMAAAQSDPGAFIEGAELMIDAAWTQATNRLAAAMFRNGAGTLGQVMSVSLISGNNYLVTLTNPDDAVFFEAGQILQAVQNVDGSGSAPVDVASVYAIDRNGGTLKVTCSTNIVTNWPANYFLATAGDLPSLANNNFQPASNASTNKLLKIAGLAAWIPLVAPSAGESFFGVDRSVDVQRLAGVSFDGTALALEEAILQGTGRIAMNGGKVDTGICSYATYTALVVSLGSKVSYVDEKVGEIGFRGIQVNGANSVISIFPDRNCPDGLIYFLEIDTWCLRSTSSVPGILKYADEIEILRIPGVDAAEVRVGGYMNMYTTKPGHNGVVKVQLQEF